MKALMAFKESEEQDQDLDDDEDQKAPIGVGGPASSANKRKRAGSAKEVNAALLRGKEVAESLEIELE